MTNPKDEKYCADKVKNWLASNKDKSLQIIHTKSGFATFGSKSSQAMESFCSNSFPIVDSPPLISNAWQDIKNVENYPAFSQLETCDELSNLTEFPVGDLSPLEKEDFDSFIWFSCTDSQCSFAAPSGDYLIIVADSSQNSK